MHRCSPTIIAALLALLALVASGAPLADACASARPTHSSEPLAQRRKAKKKAPKLQPFIGTLEEAQASALERNVPLLIHVILEDEEQNDEYRDEVLSDAALRSASERAVVIVANNGEHALTMIKEEVDGRSVERKVCSVYRMFERCELHRAPWDPIYFEYHNPDGEMLCPQTVVRAPGGEISWRHNDGNPAPVEDILFEVDDAREVAGIGLTLAELREVKRLLGTGRLASKDKGWASAWKSWTQVTERVSTGPLHEESATGTVQSLAAMQAQLDALIALLVPGSAKDAYRRLTALVADFDETPLEKDAKTALARAGKNKSIRDEVALAKLEIDAQKLWDKGQALLRGGSQRKGESIIRRLLRKKYRQTDVAARAREKYPEWAAEEEAKGK